MFRICTTIFAILSDNCSFRRTSLLFSLPPINCTPLTYFTTPIVTKKCRHNKVSAASTPFPRKNATWMRKVAKQLKVCRGKSQHGFCQLATEVAQSRNSDRAKSQQWLHKFATLVAQKSQNSSNWVAQSRNNVLTKSSQSSSKSQHGLHKIATLVA